MLIFIRFFLANKKPEVSVRFAMIDSIDTFGCTCNEAAVVRPTISLIIKVSGLKRRLNWWCLQSLKNVWCFFLLGLGDSLLCTYVVTFLCIIHTFIAFYLKLLFCQKLPVHKKNKHKSIKILTLRTIFMCLSKQEKVSKYQSLGRDETCKVPIDFWILPWTLESLSDSNRFFHRWSYPSSSPTQAGSSIHPTFS